MQIATQFCVSRPLQCFLKSLFFIIIAFIMPLNCSPSLWFSTFCLLSLASNPFSTALSSVLSEIGIKFCHFLILQWLSTDFNIKSKLLSMVKSGSFIWPLPLTTTKYPFIHKNIWTFTLFPLLGIFYSTFISICLPFKTQLKNLLLP